MFLRGTIARKYSFRIEYSTIEILQRSFQFYASMFSDYANYLSLVSVGYVGEVSKRNRKIARKLNGTARFFDRIVLDGSSVIGEMRFGGNAGQFEACLGKVRRQERNIPGSVGRARRSFARQPVGISHMSLSILSSVIGWNVHTGTVSPREHKVYPILYLP